MRVFKLNYVHDMFDLKLLIPISKTIQNNIIQQERNKPPVTDNRQIDFHNCTLKELYWVKFN